VSDSTYRIKRAFPFSEEAREGKPRVPREPGGGVATLPWAYLRYVRGSATTSAAWSIWTREGARWSMRDVSISPPCSEKGEPSNRSLASMAKRLATVVVAEDVMAMRRASR